MHILLKRCVDWGTGLMDKLKLKWWIFAYLLGFSTLLLIILWLFQTVFLYDMYKYSRRIEIQRAVSYVRENINNQDLYSLFDELQREKEILVMPTNQFTPPKNHAPVDRRRRRGETITQTEEFVLNDGRTLSLTFHAIITPVDATVTTLHTTALYHNQCYDHAVYSACSFNCKKNIKAH